MPLTFVNFLGETVDTTKKKEKAKTVKKDKHGMHMGFRVIGVPPGTMEKAIADHTAFSAMSINKDVAAFDKGAWLCSAKKKPVRSKPYFLREAAEDCAKLAEKAGWLSVAVIELKTE